MDQTPARNRIVLPLAVAALLGGGVAATVTTLVDGGGGGTTTTVFRQAALDTSNSRINAGDALTPRDIYKRLSPGVVFIKADVVQRSQTPFDLFPQQQRSQATGSGFVVDKNGDILTNAHVVSGASKVTVQFADKKTVDAKVVGVDQSTDIALLKVDPGAVDLTVLPLGSAKDVQVGDPTIAIGNPFGLDRTLTTGVVSALQRQIQAPNGFAIDNVIQTDAAINPGNSGGPLIDGAGEVIGINSQIETGGSGASGNVGIGFAVPIDTARRVLSDLKAHGKVERAYLGVSSTTVDSSLDALDLPVKSGALVQKVDAKSPAAKAGIKAGDIQAQVQGATIVLGGDIITAVDGKPVKSNDALSRLVGAHKPGDSVKVTVVRNGGHRTLTVKLAPRPGAIQIG